jgi:shikimate kinase
LNQAHQNASANGGAHQNIVLVGAMGSGKSAVGYLLAHMLGFGFIDTDAEIEAGAGKSVARIFKEQGEDAFRSMERKVVARAASAHKHVIATGGGALEDDESWRALTANGLVVWLNPPVEELVRRLASGPDSLKQLAVRPYLEELADLSGMPSGGNRGPAMQQFMADRRKRLGERIKALLAEDSALPRSPDHRST